MINHLVGDATIPATRPAIIAHVVNNVGAFGAGFALAIANRHPSAKMAYQAWHRSGMRLGDIQIVLADKGLWVANLCAQNGLRSVTNRVPLDIKALAFCLAKLRVAADEYRSGVHMPRIGCGLAGGTWDVVGPIVERELNGVDVNVYDLT